MPLLLAPPALQAPAPARPLSLEEAAWELVEAFDEGRPLPTPRVDPRHRASLTWLRAAATTDLPRNPFPAGTPAHREASRFLTLVQAPAAQRETLLRAQPLKEPGTQLALWRWSRRVMRTAPLPQPQRHLLEDRLLEGQVVGLIRGFALRHALCFALAEADEARFAALRQHGDVDTNALLAAFQSLFALLGGPSPRLRLWPLPALQPRDLTLGELGAARLWICPAEATVPNIPAGTTWIIPTSEGGTPASEATLEPLDLREAEALRTRLKDQGPTAWLAPSRQAFITLGLAFFPILIELDSKGNLARIRMGDAAPAAP